MKSNSNKFIRLIAVAITVCSLLCACGQIPTDDDADKSSKKPASSKSETLAETEPDSTEKSETTSSGLYVFITEEDGQTTLDDDGQPLTEEWHTFKVYATDENGEEFEIFPIESDTMTSVILTYLPAAFINGAFGGWDSFAVSLDKMLCELFAGMDCDNEGNSVLPAYADECDDTCDCGATRTAPHKYTSDCDDTCDCGQCNKYFLHIDFCGHYHHGNPSCYQFTLYFIRCFGGVERRRHGKIGQILM